MRFRTGELEFNATIAESSESVSPQTGSPIRSMTIQFRAQKAGVHEAAVAEALQRQSGGMYSLDADRQPEMEWRVRESTWTYIGNEPYGWNHHTRRIEQVERLAITRLRLGSVEIEPYHYVENVSDEGIMRLAARAMVTSETLSAIAAIAGSIDVVRIGISDMPRRMRLSGYVWGERPDGLAAAIACQDVREPRVTIGGFDAAMEDDLEDLLTLASVDREAFTRRRHARRKVSDIDGWDLLT